MMHRGVIHLLLCFILFQAVNMSGGEQAKVMPGGLAGPQPADAEVQSIADEVKGQVTEKLGRTFSEYKAINYSTQVVAGINYFIKVQVSPTECIHLRVYQDLQGHRSLTSVQDGKTLDDPITYF